MTCDTWHLTPDTWHMTRDMWHMTGGGDVNFLSKFWLPSSYGLGVKVLWRYFHKGSLTDWVSYFMNDEGVCRTAPATPGLLIKYDYMGSWLLL